MLHQKTLLKPLMMLVMFCLLPLGAWAQGIVKGTVNDETGEPVIGASVRVIGTKTGGVTDINGQFSVTADRNAQLEVSYVGFVSQRVAVNGRQNINIVHRFGGQHRRRETQSDCCLECRPGSAGPRSRCADDADQLEAGRGDADSHPWPALADGQQRPADCARRYSLYGPAVGHQPERHQVDGHSEGRFRNGHLR